MSKNLLNS